MLLDGSAIHRRTAFGLVLERPGLLSLSGPLVSLSVVFPAKVTVGSPKATVSLGPDCFLSCRDLWIDGETVEISRRVRSNNGAGSIWTIGTLSLN